MARRPVRELVDAALNGQLDDYLTRLRDEGKSYGSIAAALHADHGVEVSAQTIGNWLTDLAPTTEPAA